MGFTTGASPGTTRRGCRAAGSDSVANSIRMPTSLPQIELEPQRGPILLSWHGGGHVAGGPRPEPVVEAGRVGIREQLDDTRAPAARFVERPCHQGPPDAGAMRGRLDPDVFQVPPRPAILERAHPDNRAVALRDPHVVRLEVPGDDRELRVPLAHPARGVAPVRLGAVRQVRERIRIVPRGAPDEHGPGRSY